MEKLSEIDQLFVDRLVKEWKKHNGIIIACDFDDTICPFHVHEDVYETRIELIKKAQTLGQ